MVKFTIRFAKKCDCSSILRLIQELAEYEKMPDGPKLDIQTFEDDGFGREAFYKCLIAEVDNDAVKEKVIVGYSLYYFTYSTWEGKSIYMEDLYVTPAYRHKGIGGKLWREVVKDGLRKGCARTDFSVLSWNKPSIDVYLSKGAINLTSKEGWHLFRMNKEAMVAFSEEEMMAF